MLFTAIDWIGRSKDLKLEVRNFVNGRFQAGAGAVLEKYSPRDGRLLSKFGAGEAREVDEAVANARRAFEDGRWSGMPVKQRKDVLHKVAALLEKHREELALLESIDVGKPISSAWDVDVPMSVGIIRYHAEAVDKLHSKVYGVDQSSLSYQLRRPLGVVGGIVGWNFPMVLAAQKIAPVLATGNSLVLKPSELTSFSTGRLAELAIEAGVPEGVLNVIHGDPAIGAALARHPDVDMLTFTGSTQTGKKLMIAAGESNMKRLVLECGGKAPHIVFDDCPNLEAVADYIIKRAFWNQGQVCVASSRLLIQDSIKEALLPIVIKKVSALNPGDPLKAETKFGAVVSQGHKEKVLGYIDSGEKEGAKIVYQSKSQAPYDKGFYIPPVIFDKVSPSHKIAREEIFGPVLSVLSFRDEEEAVRIANNTIYGLSAILWTQNLGRAHRVSQGIKAGSIIVSATATPLGGPADGVLSLGGHKESGVGVEGGLEGMDEYTSQTAVQFFV